MADDWVTLGGSWPRNSEGVFSRWLWSRRKLFDSLFLLTQVARRPFLKGSGRATRLIWTSSLVLAIAIPAGALLDTPVASAQGSGEIFGTSCPTTQMCVSVGTPYQDDDAAYIIETTNGGSSWTEETPPSNAGVLRAVSCPSVQDCVAVGASTGTAAVIISTTDGGAVWTTD
jgi:hypothetical protein